MLHLEMHLTPKLDVGSQAAWGYEQGFSLQILFLRHREIIAKKEVSKSLVKVLLLLFCIEDFETNLSHCCVPRSSD